MVCGRSKELTGCDAPRVGYTVTKKLGNAVVRNRIKRRLRAVVYTMRGVLRPGCDYILIARPVAATRNFADLQSDFQQAMQRVHQKLPS